MNFIYYLTQLRTWAIPWLIQVIIYYRLLGKMGIDRKWAFLPFAAEGKMSSKAFRYKTTFWHIIIFTMIMFSGGIYLRYTRGNMYAKIIGIILILIGLIIYSLFLNVLYWRVNNAFHKNIFFKIGTVLLPAPFLFVLGNKKSVFYGWPEQKYLIKNKPLRIVFRGIGELAFLGQAAAVFYFVFSLSTALYPPRFMVEMNITDKMAMINGLKGDGRVVDRVATMDMDEKVIDNYFKGRDPYFDHSEDESVVVLEYIIGSNLEDNYGLCSYNIEQIKNATKEGSALKFVIEAGGSYRWFTDGINDETVGRYEIADGKLTKVGDVEESTSMSYPDELYDFLLWAKKNYEADRYMLVFWDHGGGLSSGFGSDDLNKRTDTDYGTMLVNEIIEAVDRSNIRFDLIGFDACLMQDIEIAKAFEKQQYQNFHFVQQHN